LLASPRKPQTWQPPIVDNLEAAQIERSTEIEELKTQNTEGVGEAVKLQTIAQPTEVAARVITSVQRGLKEGETRATFIVQEAALEKIKAVAYWDRKNIKDVVQAIFEDYITAYEAKNGEIKAIP
jgi:hypothetical protein